MAKKSKRLLLIVLYVIIACSCVLVLFYFLTDGFKGSIKTFSVTIGDSLYTTDSTEVHISRNTTMSVHSVDSFDIAIYAHASEENNFSFMLEKESYEWMDLNGKDFTKAFSFTPSDDDKIQISYGSIQEIFISVYPGYSIFFDVNKISSDIDMFDMVITCARTSMSISFSIDVYELFLELSPSVDSIIF